MDFFEALRIMADGERVTKLEWGNQEFWGQILDGKLVLHKPDGVYYPWIVSDGDLHGDDWEVLVYA